LVQPIAFIALGQRVRIDCDDATLRRILVASFAGMAVCESAAGDLRYRILASAGGFQVHSSHGASMRAESPAEALFLVEKDITVELQRRRPDLLFLHAGAVALGEQAVLLVAESGRGKSTTTWGLIHQGFSYLSDELSPVDGTSLQVLPYPFAICLKHEPAAYPLPEERMKLEGRTYVPATALPAPVAVRPCTIHAVFLLGHPSPRTPPDIRRVSPAEASARLYVSTLNALAHPHHGLDAVVDLARRVPCYHVEAGDVRTTCNAIRARVVDDLPPLAGDCAPPAH
jgi:hypothetical protein